MQDTPYDALIEDCLQERASLIGFIEAIETGMLAPGMPIAIPDDMKPKVTLAPAAFKQAVDELNALIDAYEASAVEPQGQNSPTI